MGLDTKMNNKGMMDIGSRIGTPILVFVIMKSLRHYADMSTGCPGPQNMGLDFKNSCI